MCISRLFIVGLPAVIPVRTRAGISFTLIRVPSVAVLTEKSRLKRIEQFLPPIIPSSVVITASILLIRAILTSISERSGETLLFSPTFAVQGNILHLYLTLYLKNTNFKVNGERRVKGNRNRQEEAEIGRWNCLRFCKQAGKCDQKFTRRHMCQYFCINGWQGLDLIMY